MKKRILLVVLCIAMLVAALPVAASAVTDPHAAMYQQVKDIYKKTLRSTGLKTMEGYCGMLASYELYYLGITEKPEVYNGKEQFDKFSAQTVTTGGHTVKSYSARQYTLEGALNAITRGGTQDARNILVGFERTKYEGGDIYGHVVVIHAILDGIVYSIDNSRTDIAGKAGTPIVCTIAEFAKEYDRWATFDGAVDFGTKAYADQRVRYGTDLYISALSETKLLTQPRSGSSVLRTVASGERLWATDVYESDGLYYRVSDGNAVGYIRAEAVRVVRYNTDGVSTAKVSIPTALRKNRDQNIYGYIQSSRSDLAKVELVITNDQGDRVIQIGMDALGQGFDLSSFNRALDFRKLNTGVYQLAVYADVCNEYATGSEIKSQINKIPVLTQQLTIGGAEAPAENADAFTPESVRNGWFYENGQWYCYRDGAPRTGWYCYDGVDYYLKSDGSVTTGQVKINGQDRYFSPTGAMRTGWMETDSGTYYLLSNGVAAKGWRTIDGVAYFFGEDGVLQETA